MKTSQEWWKETKADKSKFNYWLQRQCFGELKAYERISELAAKFNKPILKVIANQELTHHEWIKDYLMKNDIQLISFHEERYWKQVDLDFDSLEQAAAVAAHAEKMRLERIRVIAGDLYVDTTLSGIFARILIDETFHERWFRELSTDDDLKCALHNHEQGMLQLGLVI